MEYREYYRWIAPWDSRLHIHKITTQIEITHCYLKDFYAFSDFLSYFEIINGDGYNNMHLINLRKALPITFTILFSCSLFEPDTGVEEKYNFFSSSLNEMSTVWVYYPESYASSTPVIYLLNGFFKAPSGEWGSEMDLQREAHNRDIIFVSINSGSNTYTNNTSQTNANYEDYVLEVVSTIEDEFAINIDYTKRALCGISGGGGGAVYLLSQYPDNFMACGSLSGTVYGTLIDYGNLADRDIRIDVGQQDLGILSDLRWLHNKLNENHVDHEYYEHSGEHDWTFWRKWTPNQFDFLEAIISS